jgi:hypothetical protein
MPAAKGKKSKKSMIFLKNISKKCLTWPSVSVILSKLARAGVPKGARQEGAGANLENDTEEVNAQL